MAGKRLYTCNYRYFQNIDSEEKAYWLGFIMADGHIFETYKGNRPNPARGLKITLSVVDKDHLYKCSIYLERKYRKYQSLNNGRS